MQRRKHLRHGRFGIFSANIAADAATAFLQKAVATSECPAPPAIQRENS